MSISVSEIEMEDDSSISRFLGSYRAMEWQERVSDRTYPLLGRSWRPRYIFIRKAKDHS